MREEVIDAANQVIEFLDKYPEVKEIVYKNLAESRRNDEQKSNSNTNRKRKKVKRSFVPYILATALITSGVFAVHDAAKNNGNITFPVDNEVKYETINEAPVEIQQAYVEDQYAEYLEAVDSNANLENISFDKNVPEFRKLVSGGADKSKINEVANNINNSTLNDSIDDTLPFTSTSYSRSIVEDGSIYEPVNESTQFEDDEELIVKNGSLYRRR